MLRGYRDIIPALGLVISSIMAAGASLWLLNSAATLQVGYEHSAKVRADQYAKRRDVIIKYVCSALPGQSQADCINKEREAAREGYRNEYELEAQRITAAWTAHMGWAAIIGMAVGTFSLGLIFFTFRETRKANIIAAPPQLAVFQIALNPSPTGLTGNLVVSNIGRNTCKIKQSFCRHRIQRRDARGHETITILPVENPIVPQSGKSVYLTGGQNYNWPISFTFDLSKYRARIESSTGDLAFFVQGVIWFEDELGLERGMRFLRKYDPKTGLYVPSENPDYEYNG